MTKHCWAVDRHSLALAVFRGSYGRWTIRFCHYGSITCPSAPTKLSLHGVFVANGSKFQMRATTWCPKCNQVKLCKTNKQKIPDSPSSTAPHGNTSFVCCYLCGFNTNCRIILIDPSAFGSITQHKLVQLLPHHCTVFKILLFNKKKKQGKTLHPVHLNNIVAMSSKLHQNLGKKHTISLLISAGQIFLFRCLKRPQLARQRGTSGNHFQVQFQTQLLTRFSSALITSGRPCHIFHRVQLFRTQDRFDNWQINKNGNRVREKSTFLP